MANEYSFCESVSATDFSPLCIRELGETRQIYPGGGVDTNSLCGRVQSPKGWDIPDVEVRANHPFCCAKCARLFTERK